MISDIQERTNEGAGDFSRLSQQMLEGTLAKHDEDLLDQIVKRRQTAFSDAILVGFDWLVDPLNMVANLGRLHENIKPAPFGPGPKPMELSWEGYLSK